MRTIHIDTYYTSLKSLSGLYNGNTRKMGFSAKSKDQLETWRAALRATLAETTGLEGMQRASLEPALLESARCEGYRRDKVLIRTEPDVWMPMYVLVPDGARPGERRPCVIAPHGHRGAGKLSVAGLTEIPAVKDAVDTYHSDYGVQLVREGYVVFCPDARAMGERREAQKQGDDEEAFMSCSCLALNNMAMGLGRTVTGMWTWDLMRLIDYIETREDCDPRKIACAGFSSGGQQALWLAAMDERVKCAVISGYFYGYRESLFLLPTNCSCNYVPRLWEHADMGDLGALVAPRLLLIESGTSDPLNGARGIANVTEQVRIAQGAYDLLGCADRLHHYVFEGGHMWKGDRAAGFLTRMEE